MNPQNTPNQNPPEQQASPDQNQNGQQRPPEYSQSGPDQQQSNQPQVVYMARPHDPTKPEISPATLQKHEESKRKYPGLNLSEGEFIISAIRRHPVGLLSIWAGAGTVIIVLLIIMVVLGSGTLSSGLDSASPATPALPIAILAIPVILISILTLIFAAIGTMIYNANRFFLTNESVIQQIQTSLFSKREQTVSLSNVEDASYTQDGIIPHLLNYGMLRLSTQGDETTYRFNYASSPQSQIALLNNAVEAFKNGRPVSGED